MNGSQLRQALHDGTPVLGTLVVSPSPHVPKVISQLGHDFVFIDTEHIAIEREKLSWMCQTFRALCVAPVVRIPSPDPYEACKVLDGGACGVIAPYIETPGQVKQLVGAVKMRPLKGQLLQAYLSGEKTMDEKLSQYLNQRNAENVLIVNTESVPAVDQIDAIASVEGLDAILVGPNDLSVSLGIPEEYENPRFTEAVDHLFDRARAHGIGAGIHMIWQQNRQQHELRWVERGANLLVHSADLISLRETMSREIGQLRDALGLSEEDDAEAINI